MSALFIFAKISEDKSLYPLFQPHSYILSYWMDWRLLLDGLTSAIADILFIYSVLQIIIPCLSELGIDIFHKESIWSSRWFIKLQRNRTVAECYWDSLHRDNHDNFHENNETLDYGLNGFLLKTLFISVLILLM